MKKLGLNEIRTMFRDFYVSKGHYPGKSASLIPDKDPSLLIINSGMAPLKPYFAGAKTPPSKRMTTCQKCIRTGDIENVGITARHGTFFEMLGNFSFGDYFKKESLTWGWEFITKWLEIDPERVWATVYQDDDEAVEIWKEIGMPEERIVRLGKEDNFWEIGLGPCGPCSEIYYDRGEEFGCGKPDCKPGCDCDRYMEFWNHVFTQFSREADGSLSNLAHPNIDTGMGLERLACLMQGVDSIFDIDTIRYILDGVVAICDKEYEAGDPKADISIRIITDHLRSMVFMIADDIQPSNEGRGYVLRRLIRRAARHGKLLGIEPGFLSGLADRVIEISGEAYPELVERKDYIKKIISIEEEKFEDALGQGSAIIQEYIEDMQKAGEKTLSGEKAFTLYDTFGFPVDLTAEILKDEGMDVDMAGFEAAMQKQKDMSRAGRRDTSEEAWDEEAAPTGLPATEFTGYDELETEGSVLAIYDKKGEKESAQKGDQVRVYLDRTPFYAESGGQVSDNGFMSNGAFNCRVTKVTKENGVYCHEVEIMEGTLKKGDKVLSNVNIYKRNSTARNHTATHLLQKALQEVLGDHVQQSGSKNDENMLRFDFTHYEAMTPEEIEKTEYLVNQKIMEFLPVTTEVMSLPEAKKRGAMALFGEKYGDEVRVVSCGDWSMELCGGTHVKNTGELGAFRILSESGSAAGVRRIEAVTATGLLIRDRRAEAKIQALADTLKATPSTLPQKAESVMTELRETKKELEDLKKNRLSQELDIMVEKAKEINGIRLITHTFHDVAMNELRELQDQIRAKKIPAITVFCAVNDGKVVMMVAVTEDLTKKYQAGKLIKSLAKEIGGGGGGKADMAQAGGWNEDGIEKAFKLAETLIK